MAAYNEDLTKNEFWRRKYHTFMTIRDTNKDGMISKADYTLIIQRYKDMGVSEKHLQKLEKNFYEMLKAGGIEDDTTALTYEEYSANFRKNAKDYAKNIVNQFEVIDSDENGEISFEEWLQHYKAHGIDTVHARPSFDAMDTNGDGVVSKEEFIAYSTEYFYTAEDKLKSSLLYGPLLDWTCDVSKELHLVTLLS